MPISLAVNTVSHVPDEESIQRLLRSFTEARNAHDATRFSEVFKEDADFTNVMGVSRHGINAIVDLHAPLFKTIWADSTLTITRTTTRFIKPDVAAVDAWWTLEGLKNVDGADRRGRNGLLNFIMTKQNNKWLVIVMHNMDLPQSVAQKC
jgi:uncharacterized protein (TIGR02246 family)